VEETNEWIPLELNCVRELLEEEIVLDPGNGDETNFVAAKDIITTLSYFVFIHAASFRQSKYEI
jgi:hypothetical protein